MKKIVSKLLSILLMLNVMMPFLVANAAATNPNVTFYVDQCKTTTGQSCWVVGDFSNWSTTGGIGGLKLFTNQNGVTYPKWMMSKSFTTTAIQFKFAVVNDSTGAIVSYESLTANRSLTPVDGSTYTATYGVAGGTVVTPSVTATPTKTPVPTATPIVTSVPTATPTKTPIPTATPTPDPKIPAITYTTDSSGGYYDIRVKITDSDTGPSSLTMTVTSSNQSIVADNKLSYDKVSSYYDRIVRILSFAGGYGQTNITIMVSDGSHVGYATIPIIMNAPTPTPIPTATPVPTKTPVPTATPTPTPKPTATPVPTATPSPTPTPVPTYSVHLFYKPTIWTEDTAYAYVLAQTGFATGGIAQFNNTPAAYKRMMKSNSNPGFFETTVTYQGIYGARVQFTNGDGIWDSSDQYGITKGDVTVLGQKVYGGTPAPALKTPSPSPTIAPTDKPVPPNTIVVYYRNSNWWYDGGQSFRDPYNPGINNEAVSIIYGFASTPNPAAPSSTPSIAWKPSGAGTSTIGMIHTGYGGATLSKSKKYEGYWEGEITIPTGADPRVNLMFHNYFGILDDGGNKQTPYYNQCYPPACTFTDGVWNAGPPSNSPSLSPAPMTAIQMVSGSKHHLILRSDGTVWAWGDNTYGQLGIGTDVFWVQKGKPIATPAPVTYVDEAHAVRIVGLKNIKQLFAGANSSFALLGDGTLMAWGQNDCGQLGDLNFNLNYGDFDARVYSPMISRSPKDAYGKPIWNTNSDYAIKQVASEVENTHVLLNNGLVYSFGKDGGRYKLGGVYPNTVRFGPQLLKEVRPVTMKAVAVPYDLVLDKVPSPFNIAMKAFGVILKTVIPDLSSCNVFCVTIPYAIDGPVDIIPQNNGHWSTGFVPDPRKPLELNATNSIAAFVANVANQGQYNIRLKDTGINVISNGDLPEIALGSAVNSPTSYLSPDGIYTITGFSTKTLLPNNSASSPNPSKIVDMRSGLHHTILLRADGHVSALGDNTQGQVGSSKSYGSSLFSEISNVIGMDNIVCKQIAASDTGSACLDQSGKLYAWGTIPNVISRDQGVQLITNNVQSIGSKSFNGLLIAQYIAQVNQRTWYYVGANESVLNERMKQAFADGAAQWSMDADARVSYIRSDGTAWVTSDSDYKPGPMKIGVPYRNDVMTWVSQIGTSVRLTNAGIDWFNHPTGWLPTVNPTP